MTLPLSSSKLAAGVPDLADYMTTQEAAAKLGFHVEHVRRMMREKALEGVKVGASWLVSKQSVERYLRETEGMAKYDPRRGGN